MCGVRVRLLKIRTELVLGVEFRAGVIDTARSVRSIINRFTNTVSDDLMISQVNRISDKPCVLRKMFDKLDVRRKSIVTSALS